MRFIVNLLLLLLLVCVVNCDPPKQPNIIYILSDDLGHQDLGFTGGHIETPNLDKLAREGVVLREHYVQPICTPTRGTLMSGRYPIHTGLQHSVIHPGEPWGLPLDETLIPEVLREYNYSTHAVGKWHLGMHSWDYTPLSRGFDDFFGYYLGSQNYDTHVRGGGYDLRSDYRDEKGHLVDEVRYDLKGRYSTELYTARVVDLINKSGGSGPFFIYLAYQNVHAPHMVPQRYIDQYTSHITSKQEKTFAGMVSAMDEGVGNITLALERAGLADNTVIVFSSDNGANVNCVGHVTASNYPYRGGKRSLYEGGIRSPSFVWGRGLPAGKETSLLIHVSDWLPTFWGLASLGGSLGPNRPIRTQPLDGVDQWAGLVQLLEAGNRTEILLNIDLQPLPCGHRVPNAGIRWKEWKLILGSGGPPSGWYPPPGLSECPPDSCHAQQDSYVELYNLREDPYERHNVSAQHPRVVEHLVHKILKYNQTAVVPGNLPHDPASNPKYFNHTWVPWMKSGDQVRVTDLVEEEGYLEGLDRELGLLPDPCHGPRYS